MASIENEKRIVAKMIRIYCFMNHKQKKGLCEACENLKAYSHNRLDRCQFGDEKSACEICPVHCYQSKMREQMKQVMRYSGKFMPFIHPLDTLEHYLPRILKK